MKREELYQICDLILNEASFDDLEVIRKALARREGAVENGAFTFSPGKMAKNMSRGMEEQMASTREMIRSTVGSYVEEMIRREAPELSDSQVEELMQAWIPSAAKKRKGGRPRQSRRLGASDRERELLETMVWQFVEYSLQRMPVRQQRELEAELGDWTRVYWKRFPEELQELLSLFLKGAVEQEDFESSLAELLGRG